MACLFFLHFFFFSSFGLVPQLTTEVQDTLVRAVTISTQLQCTLHAVSPPPVLP